MDNMDQPPQASQQGEIEDSFDEEPSLVAVGSGNEEAQVDVSISSMESTNRGDGMDIDDVDSFGDRIQEDDAEMATPTCAVSPSRDSSFDDDPPTITRDSVESDKETELSMIKILKNIVLHAKFCFSDIDKVVKCFTESSEEVRIVLKDILMVLIGELFLNANINPHVVSAICRFTAVVAIRAYQEEECFAPFTAVQEVLEIFMKRPEDFCRIRSCELITWMLTTATESSEFMDGVHENKLPSVPALQWCVDLCRRRTDVEAGVRCAALKAISRLHLDKFFDHMGRQATPFALICESLRDYAPEVRKVAIHVLPLSSREGVDMAIRFLGFDGELPSLRLQMAERIIRDVHLKSFTERQKIAFLEQLYNDKDEEVKSLLGTRVVGTWLRALAHDDLNPMDEEENNSLPAHPMALLKYLNCVKHEKIVALTVKLAFSHYMNAATETRTNPIEHLSFIRKMPVALRESSGVLHNKTVSMEIQADGSDLHERIFMHRCLVEFLTGLCADSAANKDIVASRLLPNALDLSTLFQEYSSKIFSSVSSVNQQFIYHQILLLLHLTDLDCPVGKKAFDDALKTLIAGESLSVPISIVEHAVDEVWDHVVKADEFDKNEFIDWAGFAVGRLLDSVPSLHSLTSADMRTYSEDEADTILRAGTIVHCILRNPSLTNLSPLMRSAFQRLVVPLESAKTTEGRELISRLIGLTACLDTTGSIVVKHANTFRQYLMTDYMEVKVVAFLALTDVCWKYGFGVVSKNCFPEIPNKLEARETLAGMPEQLVTHAPASQCLQRVMFDACRMLTRFIWPKLIGAMFYRVFNRSADSESEHTARVFFDGFAERGLGAKVEIISGFFECCDIVDENAGQMRRFRFGALMTFVCELMNKKLKKEPTIQLPNGSTVDTVFAVNLLKRIGADPFGTVQPQLACVCLPAINVSKIVKGDAVTVLRTASSVQNRLTDDDSLAKMHTSVVKFVKSLEKQTDLEKRNQPVRKTPRRCAPVKLEEPYSDFDDTDVEEQYSARPKRPRLSRASGSSWSRSDETVKEELFSQRVKEEIIDEYWKEPEEEAIIIDSENEDELTIISVKAPRSRHRRATKRLRPVLEDE